jgi:hypothetical protein
MTLFRTRRMRLNTKMESGLLPLDPVPEACRYIEDALINFNELQK